MIRPSAVQGESGAAIYGVLDISEAMVIIQSMRMILESCAMDRISFAGFHKRFCHSYRQRAVKASFLDALDAYPRKHFRVIVR